MIDPSMWINEDFGTLSVLAKLVFIGLFSNADDEGKGKASPAYIKAVLFPYNDDLRIADIEKALLEISSKMSVIFYSCDENKYYTLTSWNTFQKIDKPTESKIPDYDVTNQNIRLLFEECSTKGSRGVPPKRKEYKRKEYKEYGENKNVKFTDEEYEKVKAYFPKDYKERIQALDDYMQSKGKKYKDYFATLKTWARKEGYKPPSNSEPKKQVYKAIDTSTLSQEDYARLMRKETTIEKLMEEGKVHV